MDKKILAHKNFMEAEIKNIEHKLAISKTKEESTAIDKHIAKLTKYHAEIVHNFQHERLIHLIVTIFFAGLLFLAILGMLSFSSITASEGDMYLLNILSTMLFGILFITEIFYVRYYYQLENGTQQLYKFTEKLYQIGDELPHIDTKP